MSRTKTNNASIQDLELFKKVLTASCYDESAWTYLGQYDANNAEDKPSFKRKMKERLIRALAKSGYKLVKEQPFDMERRRSGDDWPLFGYTMVGHKRLDNIEHCIETVLKDEIEGDIIETGVWRGGAMMFAKAVLNKHSASDRSVWCADSFEGLPKQYGRDSEIRADPDLAGNTHLGVSQPDVEANFRRFDLLDENVKFVKGWFSDTLHKTPIEKVAVLRLDGDLYESTMDALDALYPKVSNGGFVIVDDYGSWKGCSAAVDEFRDTHGITAAMEQIDKHGYFWRVPKV